MFKLSSTTNRIFPEKQNQVPHRNQHDYGWPSVGIPASDAESVIGKRPLKKILQDVKVSKIIDDKERVAEIHPTATVFDAVKLMSDRNIGSVLVTQEFGKRKGIAGIFTERDYLRKIILKEQSSKSTHVGDVMTPDVITASSQTSVSKQQQKRLTGKMWDVGSIMARNKFRHLPIIPSAGEDLDPNEPALAVISSKVATSEVANAMENASDGEFCEEVNTVLNHLARKSSTLCYVGTSTTVFQALQIMESHNIGAVFVTSGPKLVGIFTERDYLHKIILQGKASKTTLVKDVMTKNVISVSPTSTVRDALHTFRSEGIRNLPILPLIGKQIDYDEGRNWETVGILAALIIVGLRLSLKQINCTLAYIVKK